MKNILLALFLSFFMVSCATQTFYFNGKASDKSTRQAKVDDSDTFYFVGVGQQRIHNPAKVCGGVNKIVKVEAQYTFVNAMLRFFTFAIYSPRQFRIYCKA